MPISANQWMLTEQHPPQTANISGVVSLRSGYANYHSYSTTNDSKALINVLENVIIIDPTVQA